MSELPKGWEIRNLEDCVEILDSRRKPVNNRERQKRIEGKMESELYPYYGATGKVGFIDEYLFDDELVALGEDGVPFFDPLKHKAYLLNGRTWVNNHAHVLKGKLLDNRYLCYFLNQTDYQGFVNGATRLKLTQANMRKLPVKVAPLDEQKRIADKLDKMLEKVEAAQARLDKIPTILKRFRQSVLATATSGELTKDWREKHAGLEDARISLNEIVKLKQGLILSKNSNKDLSVFPAQSEHVPSNWNVINLGGLASKVTDGEHKTPRRTLEGHYLLSARNVRDGFISLDKVDYVDAEEFQKLRKRCNPDKGDILISCSGSVGRISLCDKDNEYVMVRSAALVKTNGMGQNNEYLMYALQSPDLQKTIVDKSKSTAQSNLFLGPIKTLPIPLPPKLEQHEIVRIVGEMFAKADFIEKQYHAAKVRLDKLTQSILAKAFRGELTA